MKKGHRTFDTAWLVFIGLLVSAHYLQSVHYNPSSVIFLKLHFKQAPPFGGFLNRRVGHTRRGVAHFCSPLAPWAVYFPVWSILCFELDMKSLKETHENLVNSQNESNFSK